MLEGEEIQDKTPLHHIRKGIAHIPEDRQHTGLAMGFSIAKNLIMKNYNQSPFSSYMLLSNKKIEEAAEKTIVDFRIKANSSRDIVKNLSGGNQQKVILAREMSGNPKVIIAAQPTRGLDIGATEYIRERLIEARNAGAAILLISADLMEILQLSDRIAVIYSGRLMGTLPKGADIHEIGLLMMGYGKDGYHAL